MTYLEAETEAQRAANATRQRQNVVSRDGNYMVTQGVPAGWRLVYGVEPETPGGERR